MPLYVTSASEWPTQWANAATTTASTNAIWTTWCTSTSTSIFLDSAWSTWVSNAFTATPPRVRTADEIAHDDARIASYRVQQAEATRMREAAERRAEELLVAHLAPEQREQFYRERAFVVTGADGFRFRIRKGRVANVDMIRPDGVVVHRLCAHPAMQVPDEDTMLAQLLMLEADPGSFMRVANRHAPLSRSAVLPPLH